MKKFGFPLQRLLDLKARREQVAAAELANSRFAAEQARQSRDDLASLRVANQDTRPGASTGVASVGELRNSEYLLEKLDETLRLAQTAMDSADARLAEGIDAFRDASQDRQVLDRIRERRLTLWLSDQAQIERALMDAVALTRFTQRRSSGEKGD